LQAATDVSPSERVREQLENKMREVFGDEMKKLSEELQGVLADDIVTAFLNRIGLFIKIEAKKRRYTRTKRSLNP
jgi:DNA recombination-dependent growth factor C